MKNNFYLFVIAPFFLTSCTDYVNVDCVDGDCNFGQDAVVPQAGDDKPVFCEGEAEYSCEGKDTLAIKCDNLVYRADCGEMECKEGKGCVPKEIVHEPSDLPKTDDIDDPNSHEEQTDDHPTQNNQPTHDDHPIENDPPVEDDPSTQEDPPVEDDKPTQDDPPVTEDPTKPVPSEEKPFCDENDCYACPPNKEGTFYICGTKEIEDYRANHDGVTKIVFVGDVQLCDSVDACSNWKPLEVKPSVQTISGHYNSDYAKARLFAVESAILKNSLFSDLVMDKSEIEISNFAIDNLHFKDVHGALAYLAKNIKLHDVDVTGLSIDSTLDYVGGLLGLVKGDESNIYQLNMKFSPDTTDILGKEKVGGMIGAIYGGNLTVSDIELSSLSVNGEKFVGGLVGHSESCYLSLEGISNQFDSITAKDIYVGGLIGQLNGDMLTLNNVLNKGKEVLAQSYAGGFLGGIYLYENKPSKDSPSVYDIKNVRNEVKSVMTKKNDNQSIGAAGFISRITTHNNSAGDIRISKVISKTDVVKGDAELGGFVSQIYFGQPSSVKMNFHDITSISNVFIRNNPYIEKTHYSYDICSVGGHFVEDVFYCSKDKYYCTDSVSKSKSRYLSGAGFVYSITGLWYEKIDGIPFNNSTGKYSVCTVASCQENFVCNSSKLEDYYNKFFVINNNLFTPKVVFHDVVVNSIVTKYDSDIVNEYASNHNNVVFDIRIENSNNEQVYELCSGSAMTMHNAQRAVFKNNIFYNTILGFNSKNKNEKGIYQNKSSMAFNMPIRNCWYNDFNDSNLVFTPIYKYYCSNWGGTDSEPTCARDNVDIVSSSMTINDNNILNYSQTINRLKAVTAGWEQKGDYDGLPTPILEGNYVTQ